MNANTPQWTIHLFGAFQVLPTIGPSNGVHFRTRTTSSLLAYLAFHKGHLIPREVAADAIWPGVPYDAVRNRFNIALSDIRVKLATDTIGKHDVLTGDTLTVGLNPDLFVTDVAEFERTLNRATRTTDDDLRVAILDEAIRCYNGDLLMGRYELWVEAEQDRLRKRYEEAAAERETLIRERRLSAKFPTSTKNRGEIAPVFPNIPHALTRFFGREGEVSHLVSQLMNAPSYVLESRDAPKLPSGENLFFDSSTYPLITLTGMGGIGKSRLAAEVTRRVLNVYNGRVWFVELADIADGNQIWISIRDTLGLSKENEAESQVIDYLSSLPAFLVLDNMEQFVESGEAVQFVNDLRRRLPKLACLVTSRHILGHKGNRSSLLVLCFYQLSGLPEYRKPKTPLSASISLPTALVPCSHLSF